MLQAEVDLNIDIDTDDVIQAHKKRMKKAGQVGFAFSQEVVPHERGQLKQSGFGPEWRGDTLVLGYQTAYAEALEKGTPGYTPPAQPLIEWAERIGKDPGFGWYVQQKIAEEGITPQPYLRPSAERMQQWLKSHPLDL